MVCGRGQDATTSGVFASAEEFSHLLDENENTSGKDKEMASLVQWNSHPLETEHVLDHCKDAVL